MRTNFLAVVLFLSAGSTGFAQDWAREMFDHTSHDFGMVARGAKVEHRFPLENIYIEDMQIGEVHSSCTCTSVRVTKHVLKKYETSEIVAVLDTRKFKGRKDATLKVKFKPPFPAEVQLHVFSYIRSDVVFEPGSAEFGTVQEGTSVSKKVTLSYAGSDRWRIVNTECENPHLDVKAVEMGRGHRRVTYEISVELKADAPAGYIKDHIVLVTNDRNLEAARILLAAEGVVVPPISVRPSPLSLVLLPGKSVTKSLVVSSPTPFQIVEVSSSDPRFRFVVPEEAKKVQVIPVTFTAGAIPGKISGKIRIQTDLDEGEVLEVEVDGQVLPADGKTSLEGAS